MMEWLNKWDLGFMYVGCKLHPFGNERHTIRCALTSILWRAHIVEGKDRPTNSLRRNGEIWGRLLASCYKSLSQYFQLIIVLYLTVAYCVKGVSALLEFGVYADALIKNRKYWPKGVPGDSIDQYFA